MTAPIAKKVITKKPPAHKPQHLARDAGGKGATPPAHPYRQAKTTAKRVSKSDEVKFARNRKQHFMPKLKPAKSVVKYRQILAAELLVGLFLILTNLHSTDKNDAFIQRLQQSVAWLMAFFVLELMTVGGPDMARISAAFGGLMVLALLTKTVWAQKPGPNPLAKVWPYSGANLNSFLPQATPAAPGLPIVPGVPDPFYPYNASGTKDDPRPVSVPPTPGTVNGGSVNV